MPTINVTVYDSTAQNANLLPIDTRNIAPPLEGTVAPAAPAAPELAPLAAAIAAEESSGAPFTAETTEKPAEDPWAQKISIS